MLPRQAEEHGPLDQISIPIDSFTLPILVKENAEEVCEAEPETLISTAEVCEAEPEVAVARDAAVEKVSEDNELAPTDAAPAEDATTVTEAAAVEVLAEQDAHMEESATDAVVTATAVHAEESVLEETATAAHAEAETIIQVSPDAEDAKDALAISPNGQSSEADQEPPKETLSIEVEEHEEAAAITAQESEVVEVVANGHIEEVAAVAEKAEQTPLPEIVTEAPFTNGFVEGNISPVEGIVLLSASDDEVCLADPQIDEAEPLVAEVPSATPEIVSTNGHTIVESTAEVLLADSAPEEVAVAAEEAVVEVAAPEAPVEVATKEVVEEAKGEVAAAEVRIVEFVRPPVACVFCIEPDASRRSFQARSSRRRAARRWSIPSRTRL